ncbi:hypothetical protein D1O36_04780 [Streptococcus thermophilus]|nr:hypothetical protein D1O36_04780 [Streptococcus thermophilus]
MFCNSTITDLFLFVFTQLILHYLKRNLLSSFFITVKLTLTTTRHYIMVGGMFNLFHSHAVNFFFSWCDT